MFQEKKEEEDFLACKIEQMQQCKGSRIIFEKIKERLIIAANAAMAT